MLYGFFANLFGKKKNAAVQEALAELEAEGVITGAEHIEGVEKVEIIDENTPDHFGSWNPTDFDEYARRTKEITEAEQQGQAALQAALAKYGCADYDEFDRIQVTFLKHYATDPAFMQAQANVAINDQKQQLADAVTPELMEPIDGVSLELYATLMAKMTQLKDEAASHKMLAENGLDQARFNAVDQKWQARMRQAESMGGYGLMTKYGEYFAAAGQGQHGAAGQAAAGVPAGQAVAGGEPCSFERYCEILAAQAVWSQQGQDVNAMLQQTFQLDAAGFSNIGGYWSQKMMSDFTLATKMPEIQAKYEAKYKAGGGPDGDLSF